MPVLFSHYVPAEMPTSMTPAPASPPIAPEQPPVSALTMPPQMPQQPLDSFTPMTPLQPPAGGGMPALKFGKKPVPKIHDAMGQIKRFGIQMIQQFKPQR